MDPLLDTMREWGAPNKRPHSPDSTSVTQSSARKRTRIGDKARNINKVVWRKVQQHLLWRNDYHMETEVFIDDVKQDLSNVRRRILRAGATEIEHVKDRRSLPTLPTYIKLKPPLPELTAPPNSDIVNGEPSLEPAPQEQEIVPSPTSLQSSCTIVIGSDEFTSRDPEDDATNDGNDFLGYLPLSELIDGFRKVSPFHRVQGSPYCTSVSVTGCPHNQTAKMNDDLETFTNALNLDPFVPGGPYLSHLEVILLLIHAGEVSTSHFLETVSRRITEKDDDTSILHWLARKIEKFSDFGTRALGAAAYQNDFGAVDILLNEHVDINGSISSPHAAIDCHCQISVIEYARLLRLDDEGSGASDEMIAYLLLRGATKSAGVNVGLQGLLDCVLRQKRMDGYTFRSAVQSFFQRIHDVGGSFCVTGSVLETCILETNSDYWLADVQRWAVEYLLDKAGKVSSCSPLAALIYRYDPLDFSDKLSAKLLAMTEDINAYCHSVSLRKYSTRHDARPGPYNITQYMTPLQAAALRGRGDIIRRLLQYGAEVDCPARGSGGVTPLQAICSLKRWFLDRKTKMSIIELLLDRGTNVNAAPAWNSGLTALQAAAFVGDLEVAKLLVSRGAIVNAPACKYGGGTALALAARERHLNMVRFLLDSGAAIPAAGVEITPGCFGRQYEDHETILYLLRISASELAVRYGANGTPSRDYREYEAKWKDDPTYENKG